MANIFKTLWRGLRGIKEEAAPDPFKYGDIIRLRHQNGWKGTLSADNHYTVLNAATRHWILIRADNFTLGSFPPEYFELASNPIHKGTANRWSATWKNKRQYQLAEKRKARQERNHRQLEVNSRAEEYEQAIKAREMIDEKV